ncbi:Gfo/Idh/MocA family oxidoreductase [Escherichia coli]
MKLLTLSLIFDRFRPQVRDRWREQGGPGSGIWYDLAPHLLDQAITLFGLPVSMTVDLAQLRPGAQSTDYFHAILSYPQRRVIPRTMLAAAESARYIVNCGSRGSYVKYGLDPTGRTSEKWRALTAGRLGLLYA